MALLKVTQKYGLPHSIGICARIQNYFLMAIVHYASFWVRSEENWGVSPPPWKGPTLHWQRTSFAQIVQSHSTHSRHQLPELIFCQLRISKVRLVIVNHQLSWSSHTHTPLGGYSSSSSSEKRKRSFSLREGFPKKSSCSFRFCSTLPLFKNNLGQWVISNVA